MGVFLLTVAGGMVLGSAAVLQDGQGVVAPYDGFRAQVLDEVHNDLSVPATLIQYHADGTQTRTTVTTEQALEKARLIMRPVQQPRAANPNKGWGYGINDPTVRALLDWPWCDASSMWVGHRGPPGSSFVQAIPGQRIPGSASDPVCNQTPDGWSDVTMSSANIVLPAHHCGASQFFVVDELAPDNYYVFKGGGMCRTIFGDGSVWGDGPVWSSAHGNGAMGSIVFVYSVLDYFDGSGNFIYLGTEPAPFGTYVQQTAAFPAGFSLPSS